MTSTRKTNLRAFLAISLLLFLSDAVMAQAVNKCPSCWVPVTRHRLVTNVNISTTIHGYIEFLPAGYQSNPTKQYPLIINVPGRGTRGSGADDAALCYVACEGLALKIEQFRFQTDVTSNGQTYSFIVLTPQYDYQGETAADLEGMINFAVNNYRVDLNRIYLTGLSSGANMIMSYMSGSSAAAARIAAVNSISVCSGSNDQGARNFANNKIGFWGMHGQFDTQCSNGNTSGWSNRINSFAGGSNPALAKYSFYSNPNQPDGHIIWPDVHDMDYKVDNMNISQWMIQYTKAAGGVLPAALSHYEVNTCQNQVVVEWTSTQESNTNYFEIERAGADLRFSAIGKIAAAGNSGNIHNYSFTDQQPLAGTSFYRLALVNSDGVKEYFDIKKVAFREADGLIRLSPVPATGLLNLSFELPVAQKLNFTIRDVNGRSLKSWSAQFSAGSGNLPIHIDALAAGVYYLQVQGTAISVSRKFVRQ